MARSRRPAGRRSGVKLPPWALLLIGLAIGALTAWGIHLYLTRSASRNAAARAPIPAKPQAATPAASKPRNDSAANKPTETPRPKPRYDFYTILPEIERVIPDNETRKPKPAKNAKTDDTRYILQAASFGAFEEADRLKAKLALSGMEARIEKITIEGKGNFYRVRLGPYHTLDRFNADNKKLRDLGVKAIRLEVKKGPPA